MKYLVPTDFSACAQKASSVAIDLAAKAGAEIIFLHLINIPFDWTNLSAERKQTMYPEITEKVAQVESKLNEWIHQANKKNVAASMHLHYNEYKSFITDFASKENADLIVMGSQGADEMKDFIVGTNTQRVVRFSKIPVLVVKEPLNSIKKIALISDFSDENMQSEAFVSNFVTLTGAELHLVFINTPLNFNATRVISQRLRGFQSDFYFQTKSHIYNDFQFESGVKNFCKDYNIDLIIMSTHGRKGLDFIAAGSLTENVIAHLNLPVLSLPLLIHES